MKRIFLILTAAALPFAASALSVHVEEPGVTCLKVSADKMAADRTTGNLVASGNVVAVQRPFRMFSDRVSRIGNVYGFSENTMVTTCTNDLDCLHWCAKGALDYDDGREITARNMTVKMFGVPVFWWPYWWQPLNTDYGWRVMPGYRSRWGAYLLTKYVYDITDDFAESEWGLRGNTRLDLRTKNGVALGQSVRWKLGDYGKGKFKVYYLWDEDADRYDRNWHNQKKYNYANWGSEIPDERYALEFSHKWEITERDIFRVRATYFSDSSFAYDFLRDGMMRLANPYADSARNELAWEHIEDTVGYGVSVSGPLSEFNMGVARLPEFYFDVAPQSVFSLPVNYESSSRVGWLNRNYAKYGDSMTSTYYRYYPGLWADYQTFRADSYHRLTIPFKIADVLSVVPRAGLRGTYWSHSGAENLSGYGRVSQREDDVARSIVEGGITLSARGTAPIGEEWQHILEPYADILVQEANYTGLKRGRRALYFDTVDGSAEWLDQFAGRSRNLPYSWRGITPGVRNAFRKADEDGRMRLVFDFDLYAAVQFNDSSWIGEDRYHRLTKSQEDPNYAREDDILVNPGFRARFYPASDCAFFARVEWDGENDTVAFADVEFAKRFSESFKGSVSYAARDHRYWDFSSTPFDPAYMRNENFNWAKYSYLGVELEHEICDAVAWGPFIRWDMRENELDEIGAWLDLRTDCLAFRFSVSYENDYTRIDGSEYEHDWSFSMGIYLRAFGDNAGSMFGD